MKVFAIILIVALAVTFVVSFVIYRRTPAPKGSKGDEANCSSCPQKDGCTIDLYKEYKKENKK